MQKFTHVVWDFNGTILDDVNIVMESSNILLKRRNLKPIENIEYHRSNFCFPIINYYKKIGFDFEKEDYNTIADEWAIEYKNYYKQAKIQKGALEALEFFKNKNVTQIILSASEINLLNHQLEELGLSNYFVEILGLSDFKAISKLEIALEWVKNNNNAKVLYLGDTTHDYEVASKIGANCMLVSNGHQDYKVLKDLNCVVAKNLKDVLSIVESMI